MGIELVGQSCEVARCGRCGYEWLAGLRATNYLAPRCPVCFARRVLGRFSTKDIFRFGWLDGKRPHIRKVIQKRTTPRTVESPVGERVCAR